MHESLVYIYRSNEKLKLKTNTKDSYFKLQCIAFTKSLC